MNLLERDQFCWRNDCAKEVSFFDRKDRFARGVGFYAKYYRAASAESGKSSSNGDERQFACLRVDGTPGYLSSWSALQRIHDTYKALGLDPDLNVKVIIMRPEFKTFVMMMMMMNIFDESQKNQQQ